jgi:hypothetical protein
MVDDETFRYIVTHSSWISVWRKTKKKVARYQYTPMSWRGRGKAANAFPNWTGFDMDLGRELRMMTVYRGWSMVRFNRVKPGGISPHVGPRPPLQHKQTIRNYTFTSRYYSLLWPHKLVWIDWDRICAQKVSVPDTSILPGREQILVSEERRCV